MHKQRVKKLADFVRRSETFDMAEPIACEPGCGSAGCIGGHAAVLWKSLRRGTILHAFTWDQDKLRKFLDLDSAACYELCYPLSMGKSVTEHMFRNTGFHSYKQISQEMAVKVLDNLAETGQVDWKVAL